MEEITGYIEHIIYSNKDNGYTVFEMTTDAETITCVGYLHAVDEGENVHLKGEYKAHPMYGDQFAFTEYEIMEPTDETEVLRYLSSGAIKGIGEALAGRIVNMFGADTFRVMEEEPELLARVKGISMSKAQLVAAQVVEKQELRRAMIFLQRYGISNNLAMKIYAAYGDELYDIIQQNPYRLAEDIEGVGFKTADDIASRSGIAIDSDYRIRSGLMYTLSESIAEGHCYLPKDELIARAEEILGTKSDTIDVQLNNLTMDRKLVIRTSGDEVRVYSNRFYNLERSCAVMLSALNITENVNRDHIRKEFDRLNEHDRTKLDEIQLDAACNAALHGVCIITGGPGTGKTTTINRILQYYEMNGYDMVLAAPTGRAAKRMTETTGYEASTIQRLLGLSVPAASDRGYAYDRNEDNPIEADLIVIDEMSMVDLPLFNALLKAIIPGTHLVLVGDTNQLPSVGPGSVLKDIIASDMFSTTCLKKIFRQDEESDIIVNAHKINEGILPDLAAKSKDFFFLKRDDVNVIMKHIVTLILEKLPKYVNAKPYDIQVLTPMRKGILGVETLNPILQKYLNPPSTTKNEKEYSNTLFREGDKVMQIKNNYKLEWEVRSKYGIPLDSGLGVFNGDLGIIRTINNYAETMEVEYEDGHVINYPFAGLDELELAYAVTIHKSQGSEYPAVIMPLLTGPKPLLNRNLLYTGVTRAKQCVVILGSEAIVAKMVENANEQKRYTSLNECLIELTE